VEVLRAQAEQFRVVPFAPTVSRLVDRLAADADAALAALRSARARGRVRAWYHDRQVADEPGREVNVDLEASVVVAHSDKVRGAPTFKWTFGSHPLLALRRPRPGQHRRAASRPAAPGQRERQYCRRPHLDLAPAALPAAQRGAVLVRSDSGAGTRAFVHRITDLGLHDSVGFGAREPVERGLAMVPLGSGALPLTLTVNPATAPRWSSAPGGCRS